MEKKRREEDRRRFRTEGRIRTGEIEERRGHETDGRRGNRGKRAEKEGRKIRWMGSEKNKEECDTRNDISVIFWNVAGLKNKYLEFWKGLEKWDIMVLMETWVEEKEWGKIRSKLLNSHG